MPIRYFKCHTLPFPSYDVSLSQAGNTAILANWRNGPNGQDEGTAYAELVTLPTESATAITIVTASGTVTSLALPTAIPASSATYQVRIRRQNSSGYGIYSEAVTIAASSSEPG